MSQQSFNPVGVCGPSKPTDMQIAIRENHDRDRSDGDDESRSMKRIKTVKNEDVLVQNLPSCEAYEKSYMHRDIITHVLVATKTQFLITASVDGFIKFWKKSINGIDFVKTFKSHAGPIEDIALTPNGGELASISRRDKSVKIFDVVNFDMINMFSLNFEPSCVEWMTSKTPGNEDLIISDSKSSKIYIFDPRQPSSEPKRVIDSIHNSIVCRVRYNPNYKTVVSVDVDGHFRYWRATETGFTLAKPQLVHFQSIEETDLKEFSQVNNGPKIRVHNISFTPNGDFFSTTSSDRKIRVFRFRSGKLLRTFDESLAAIQAIHKTQPLMDNMNFARKLAIERELDKNSMTAHENSVFDQSGAFILFPTMLGVKIYNWKTNRFIRSIGKDETNFRPLCISLFQGLVFEKTIRKYTIDSIESGHSDPTLYCSAFKKNRFYCFSQRNFEEDSTEGENGELLKDRDVYNEKPTREEAIAAIEMEQQQRQKDVYENATIHTTMGDIHLKLFPQLAPKACENFSVHSKNNYYNNHIFHRVIKQFMIQTGDPTGTGTGGESIWGDDFEDEFCDELKHDKPFILSMANCGPNTNGSQFFITVAPCPFLNNKHTIFGRVVRGMDVCQNISKVKTNPKTDKPVTDIKIINIRVF